MYRVISNNHIRNSKCGNSFWMCTRVCVSGAIKYMNPYINISTHMCIYVYIDTHTHTHTYTTQWLLNFN